ncbi:MAG: hypothetical protein M2R45_04475 [Verrucomicrobia subdivision 3 bacterium]|nr:hypothetical protein [Limisphaerales bacterium]MCS1412682.1 hypothetical protein [Limisphaerales bacterium]
MCEKHRLKMRERREARRQAETAETEPEKAALPEAIPNPSLEAFCYQNLSFP